MQCASDGPMRVVISRGDIAAIFGSPEIADEEARRLGEKNGFGELAGARLRPH